MLASCVERYTRNARDTCGGSRVDDGAPSVLQHMPNLMLQGQPGSPDVDSHDALEFLVACLLNRTQAGFHAGVVYRNFNSLKTAGREFDYGTNIRFAAHVDFHERHIGRA